MKKLVKGDNVEVRKIPFHDYQGWWNKLTLFSPEANLKGDSLYFDLDVVITDNIDSFFTHEKDTKVVLMRDFNPTTKSFNSSIMRFNNEIMTPYVWKPYLKEKKKFNRMQGDQNVITDCMKQVPEKFKCFPDEWTFSAKWYDRASPRFKRSKWTFKQYPGAKVAVFHGKPDPLQLVDVHPHESYDMDTIAWVKKHWK
tara:strand:- start:831 stop:1421 length:591 start_codon:yes stop_codon:yes gene_type:complete